VLLAAPLLALALAAPGRAAPAAPARPAAPAKAVPARPQGTVTGLLRHRGCLGGPSSATVSVVGLEATAGVDAGGRFTLHLPPGTYSLVFEGPNLVADQRVDGVEVTTGPPRDLGVVEVWPEERPAACVPPPPSQPAGEPVVAEAPDTPSADLPGERASPAAPAPDQLWVRASPGTGPGQLGLQGNPARDDEDALGPPSFAVGPLGSLWVLDALNRRVLRFDARGKTLLSFPLAHPGEGIPVESDIAVNDDGHVFVFTAGETPILSEYDAAGRLLVTGALPVSFRSVAQLFHGRGRPVFLMQNGQAVRAELSWGGVRGEGPLPGLPVGELYARAERVGRFRAAVKLATGDGRVRRSVQLHSRLAVRGVRLVGVNRRGELVVAVDRTDGAEAGAAQAEVLLLALSPHGQLAGTRAVPPGARRFEFREFALAPDGSVVQMQSDAAEVRFVRWPLLAPPRDAVAGEGLLRGRVVENGRPAPAATVSLARPRRTVPVSSDGSFEVRLPAGVHVLVFRPPPGPGPEGPPVEVKATVAAGATVDIGAVALGAPRPRAEVPRPEPVRIEPAGPAGN
jgi:hypothetical protein